MASSDSIAAVAPHRADSPLPGLLRRLLQPAFPLLADGLLARPADEPEAALLQFVAARSPLRVAQVTGLPDLAGLAPRALCLPGDGRALLLEMTGDGWTVRLNGDDGPQAVDAAALATLFPCMAWFLAEAVPPATAPADRAVAPTVAVRLAAQALGLAMPVSMMLIIDKVVTAGASDTLRALLLGVALLTVFQYLFLWLQAIHSVRRSELDGHRDRCRTLTALLGCRDGPRYSALGWDVLQSCAESARFGAETRPQLFADCAFVALLAGLMAAFSAQLLALALAFVPAYLAVEAWGRRGVAAAAAGLTGLRGALSRRYLESVAAVELIHGLDRADYVAAQWQAGDADLVEAGYALTLRRRQAALAVEFLQKVSMLVIMLLGVEAVIAGTLTLGQYIAVNLLSMQLGQPMIRMAAFRRSQADQRVRSEARQRLLRQCQDHAWQDTGPMRLPEREQLCLQVDGLSLGNPGARRLPALSFGLLGGGWLGITGRSGCGKSTLLRTLAGLERPSRGRIRLNGMEIGHLGRDALASRVRLVPQQPVIFSTSMAENIRFGDPAAAPARILAVAELCGLKPLLERLPEHLNTPIGAGGQRLSGGECQRIALARALLSGPELLLLDEATSALDEVAEGLLLSNMRRYLPGAAVVLVSHRASALSGCRQVIDVESAAAAG